MECICCPYGDSMGGHLPTGGHQWSRTFPLMVHRWAIGGPPMPGATSWHGHRWKWKFQERPMCLKTLFAFFVFTIQMVVSALRSNVFPSMDHTVISKVKTITFKPQVQFRSVKIYLHSQIMGKLFILKELKFPLTWGIISSTNLGSRWQISNLTQKVRHKFWFEAVLLKWFFEDSNMTFIAEFSNSTSKKAFIP